MSGAPLSRPHLDDGKDPEAFRTIGEVARGLGIRQHVLRYWEDQFPMLRPLTRAGGRRYYRPADVALIAEIDRLLNREGFTIRGARQAIEQGVRPAGAQAPKAALAPAVPLADALAEPAAAGPAFSDKRTAELVTRLRAVRDRLDAALSDH